MTFYNTERITLGNFLNRHPNIKIVEENTSKSTLHIQVLDSHPHEALKIRAHLKHAFGLTPVVAKEKLLDSHGNHDLVFKGTVSNQKLGEVKVFNLQGRFLNFFGAIKPTNPYTNEALDKGVQAARFAKKLVKPSLRLKPRKLRPAFRH